MNWSAIGAIILGVAVATGAFGAHGLRNRLSEYSMGIYEKAVFYHFLHALGLLMVPVFKAQGAITSTAASRICWLLLLGILLFSGSLYALVLTGVGVLGAITPIGGTAFIVAWLWLGYELLRRN